MATAAVLALPAVILTVIGWFLPHLTVVAALAVVPMAVVSYRHRFRALAACAVAAALLSFLVAGTGTAGNMLECAMVGGLLGTARRRRWPAAVVVAGTVLIGVFLSALSIGLLLLFHSIRKLTLDQVRNVANSIRRILMTFSLDGPASVVHTTATTILRDWWLAVAASVMLSTIGYVALGAFLLGPVVRRLESVEASNNLTFEADHREVGPLPVVLDGVSFRYPGSTVDALSDVSLELAPGRLVALVGDNGSGKSTLARVLAGQPPTSGTVGRPGSAGLGRHGGTAIVMQHPESQVLGVRVADDVVWGLPDPTSVDIESLLVAVGLEGMGERETSTLSGGELQRLAIAAAMARRPSLLISDESTAMVDEEGRRILVELLGRIRTTRGVGVVHVTHRREETEGADRHIRLAAGRIVADGPGVIPVPPEARTPVSPVSAPFARPLPLELRDVSYTYSLGTPWAQPALHQIDLVVHPNDGVLIVGGNGSGKSTLAWVMAGLLRPDQGSCLLGGTPVVDQVGSVGLAFQHARLQLQRPRVGLDIRAAGAPDEPAVVDALAAVGLNPDFAERQIERLSGGEQRRVAIAGLLARRPSVLILDEPLAGLDDPSRDGLLGVLAALRRDHGLTVVIISHDLSGVDEVCDRTVRLERGRILSEAASGAPR
jgi:energy-coupling factor transport system ATP-binding protein